MRRILRWLKRQIGTFDLLPKYFGATRGHFADIFWGVGVGVAVPYLVFWVYSLFRNPTASADWFAILGAVFLAGYYVWRADHIRLIPKLELGSLRTVPTPTFTPGIDRQFVQLLVKCRTEGSILDCKGQLLRVMKWSTRGNDWQPTQIDEVVDLLWSNLDLDSITIEFGADRNLNVFFAQTDWRILPRVNQIPLRSILNYAPGDIFRFDVRVSARDCPPEYTSLKATVGASWDDITVE